VIELRRADAADVDFLVEVANHPEVEPFLGERRARTADAIAEQVERSQREPERFGRLVIRVDGHRAGVMGYEELSPHNRIARLEALAVHPDFRGRGIADEAARLLQRLLLLDLGFHRLQLECYAFNERAIAHAERSGFVREGVKRKAYLRRGEWTDAVMFALLREDLEDASGASPGAST
jgi:RimJ/RimL family protein N-acetyltransferase